MTPSSETVAYGAAKLGALHRRPSMARLTTAARRRLPSSSFALPGGRYPINDASHARNALSRVSQFGSSSERMRVRSAVHRKFPTIGRKKRSLADQVTTMRHAGAFRT